MAPKRKRKTIAEASGAAVASAKDAAAAPIVEGPGAISAAVGAKRAPVGQTTTAVPVAADEDAEIIPAKKKRSTQRKRSDDVARVDGQRIYTAAELQTLCDSHANKAKELLKTKHGITVFAGDLSLNYLDFDHTEDG